MPISASLTYNANKVRRDFYKTNLALDERQEKAFVDTISFVQDTIVAHKITFIQKEQLHLWNILRALKRRLASSDNVRNLKIEHKYRQLCKGPGTRRLEILVGPLDHSEDSQHPGRQNYASAAIHTGLQIAAIWYAGIVQQDGMQTQQSRTKYLKHSRMIEQKLGLIERFKSVKTSITSCQRTGQGVHHQAQRYRYSTNPS